MKKLSEYLQVVLERVEANTTDLGQWLQNKRDDDEKDQEEMDRVAHVINAYQENYDSIFNNFLNKKDIKGKVKETILGVIARMKSREADTFVKFINKYNDGLGKNISSSFISGDTLIKVNVLDNIAKEYAGNDIEQGDIKKVAVKLFHISGGGQPSTGKGEIMLRIFGNSDASKGCDVTFDGIGCEVKNLSKKEEYSDNAGSGSAKRGTAKIGVDTASEESYKPYVEIRDRLYKYMRKKAEDCYGKEKVNGWLRGVNEDSQLDLIPAVSFLVYKTSNCVTESRNILENNSDELSELLNKLKFTAKNIKKKDDSTGIRGFKDKLNDRDLEKCVLGLFAQLTNATLDDESKMRLDILGSVEGTNSKYDKFGEIGIAEYRNVLKSKLYKNKNSALQTSKDATDALLTFYFDQLRAEKLKNELDSIKSQTAKFVIAELTQIFQGVDDSPILNNYSEMLTFIDNNKDVKNSINNIFATYALFAYAQFKENGTFKRMLFFNGPDTLYVCNMEADYKAVKEKMFDSGLFGINMFCGLKHIPNITLKKQ